MSTSRQPPMPPPESTLDATGMFAAAPDAAAVTPDSATEAIPASALRTEDTGGGTVDLPPEAPAPAAAADDGGTVDIPASPAVAPDGTVDIPSGQSLAPDATMDIPGGQSVAPDGTVDLPGGQSAAPDGTVDLPSSAAAAPRSTSTSAPKPGPALGRLPTERYIPKRFVAKGGMGEIWLTEDSGIGRQVALKRMLRADNPEQVERFLIEASITGQLEHPGIVPIHEVGTNEKGQPYYVMKFVHGRTLKKVIKDYFTPEQPSDEPREVQRLRLLDIFLNICQTVAYAHSRGVLHRDIKPENVMLGPYGETLVLDWGVAKLVGQPDLPSKSSGKDEPSDTSKTIATDLPPVSLSYSGVSFSTETMAGSIMGSPFYMAPEMAEGLTDQIDQKSDIFLLGATLYEILTGQPPRTGKNALELLKLARTTMPVAPRKIIADVPRPLEAICLKALALKKEDRYASAADMAQDMQHFLAGEPVSAYRESFTERAYRWARKHRKALGRAILAALLLVAAGVGFAKWREIEQRHQEELQQAEEQRKEEQRQSQEKIRLAEEKQKEEQRKADELQRLADAEQAVAKFRQKADEARFYAATSGPAGDNSPFFDAARGEAAGKEALAVADAWGTDLAGLPLVGERDGVKKEISDLLQLLAQQKAREGKGQETARAVMTMLDRAAAVGAASRGFHQLRADAFAALGDNARAAEEKQKSEDKSVPMTALDHFLKGEAARTRVAAGAVSPDRAGLQGAIAEYRAALDEGPNHYWSHFQLGRCYLNLGQDAEAVEAEGTCVALQPKAPWGYSVRGVALARLKRLDEAERDLNQAVTLSGGQRLPRYNLGFVWWQQKQYDKAVAEFDAVLAPPDDQRVVEAYYYRALVRLQRGEPAKAMEDFDSLLAAKPDFRSAYRLRALIRLADGQDEKGLADVNAFLAVGKHWDADSTEAHIQTGRFVRGLIGELSEIAKDWPAGTNERLLKLAMDEFGKAYAKGDRSPELLADYAAALTDYGTELAKLGHPTEALATFTTGLKFAPDNVKLLVKRGELQVRPGQLDKARADFEAALAKDPTQVEAHTWLGFIAALEKKSTEARREAQFALLHGSNYYVALHNTACIFGVLSANEPDRRAENEDLAIDLLRRAVALSDKRLSGKDEVSMIEEEKFLPKHLKDRSEVQELLKKKKR